VIDDEFFSTPPSRLIPRLSSRLRLLRAKVLARLPWAGGAAHRPDVRDELGVWNFPEAHRDFLERLSQSLIKYEGRPYPGPITLIRARSQTLWTYLERDLGWGAVARGGLDIRVVAGAHDNILAEPRVREMAAHLSASLEAAERRTRSRSLAGN
jgi:thioesterase domain-containing protein